MLYEIQEELPNIKNFGTLSPIPGFAEWFNYQDEKKINSILNKDSKELSFLKSGNLKVGDSRIVSNKEIIIKLVAHYLINEKNHEGFPIGDVTRFHLRNGAVIDDIVVNANISEAGYRRSFGVMVNYLYEMNNIEKNHEDFMNYQKIICSEKVKSYL